MERFIKGLLGGLIACLSGAVAVAAPVGIEGDLSLIVTDDGTAIYSGVPIGTRFEITIDDVSGIGNITDGRTLTPLGPPTDAGLVTITNDQILDADTADLLNALAGESLFTAGEMYDGVDVETDAPVGVDGRIEVGLSYVLPAGTFSDDDPSNYPFDTSASLLTLFFILEESGDDEIYNAFGTMAAIPVPAAGPLLLLSLVCLRRRRRE